MLQALEILVSVLLIVGAAFALIGSWGLAKLDDFYMRLHGPTKATTLGLGAILLASSIHFVSTQSILSFHEVLVTVFLFITAPASAHVLAKTALYKHFEYLGGQPDQLDHPRNLSTIQAHDLSGLDETQIDEVEKSLSGEEEE